MSRVGSSSFARASRPVPRHLVAWWMLGYLHLDGEREHRRADRCDGCRRYVKAVAVLGPMGWHEMLEADLATIDLDLIAAERGYRRD